MSMFDYQKQGQSIVMQYVPYFTTVLETEIVECINVNYC